MLTTAEKNRYKRLARIAAEAMNTMGRAQDRANEGLLSKGKAALFFYYLGKQKLEEHRAKKYVRKLRDRYKCSSIDKGSFPNYPHGLFFD
jgi:hypothetical protein